MRTLPRENRRTTWRPPATGSTSALRPWRAEAHPIPEVKKVIRRYSLKGAIFTKHFSLQLMNGPNLLQLMSLVNLSRLGIVIFANKVMSLPFSGAPEFG
jgi:hypothetical protein